MTPDEFWLRIYEDPNHNAWRVSAVEANPEVEKNMNLGCDGWIKVRVVERRPR